MTDADDRRQLRAYADGRDQDAIAAVIRRHAGMVAGVCRRVCGEPEAEDAAQAVFLVLAEKASAVASHPAPAAWLHRTATQIALRSRRGEAARRRRELEFAAMAPTRTDDAAAPGPLPELDTALATLPERYRAALVAHYLEGRDARTLATELGVSADAVAMRLSRGRDLLRSALARRGVPVAGAALLLALADAGHANEVAIAGSAATASATATALSRAHLRGLASARLVKRAAVAGALLLVVAIAASTRITAGAPPSTAALPPPTHPPPIAANQTEPIMEIQIIDQPFTRTLHGVEGRHEAGKPYGPEIIALLNQVWAAVGTAKVRTTGINHVRYYADGTMFAGVEVPGNATGLALERREVAFTRYAYYKHVGFYAKIAESTRRLLAEIERRGLQSVDGGLEIYGHNNPDESKAETELLYPVR